MIQHTPRAIDIPEIVSHIFSFVHTGTYDSSQTLHNSSLASRLFRFEAQRRLFRFVDFHVYYNGDNESLERRCATLLELISARGSSDNLVAYIRHVHITFDALPPIHTLTQYISSTPYRQSHTNFCTLLDVLASKGAAAELTLEGSSFRDIHTQIGRWFEPVLLSAVGKLRAAPTINSLNLYDLTNPPLEFIFGAGVTLHKLVVEGGSYNDVMNVPSSTADEDGDGVAGSNSHSDFALAFVADAVELGEMAQMDKTAGQQGTSFASASNVLNDPGSAAGRPIQLMECPLSGTECCTFLHGISTHRLEDADQFLEFLTSLHSSRCNISL